MKFDSKCDFTPPSVLLGLLLYTESWGIFFLVGSNILLSMVVQRLVAVLEFSQEKISECPSTPPSYNTRCKLIIARLLCYSDIQNAYLVFVTVTSFRKKMDSHPNFGPAVKTDNNTHTHTHTKKVWKYLSLTQDGFLRWAVQAPQAGLKMTWEPGRETYLGFCCVRGGALVRVPAWAGASCMVSISYLYQVRQRPGFLFCLLRCGEKEKTQGWGFKDVSSYLEGWDVGRREGGPRGRGYIYTYSWFPSSYSRN